MRLIGIVFALMCITAYSACDKEPLDILPSRPELALTVYPRSVDLYPGEVTRYSLSVSGASDAQILNAHYELDSDAAGIVTGDGTYTAGEVPGLYQLTVTATVQHGGRTFIKSATASITITEKPCPGTLTVYYEGASATGHENIAYYFIAAESEDGIEESHWYLAGDDARWFTEDDLLTERSLTSWSIDGNNTVQWTEVYWLDTFDGTWYSYAYEIHEDPEGRRRDIYYFEPGEDGAWGVLNRKEYVFGSSDRLDEVYDWAYTGSSPTLAKRTSFDYESDVRRVRYEYNTPGTDGTWFTSDDEISRLASEEYLDYTFMIPSQITTNDSPGMDGVWGTSDDSVKRIEVWSYEDAGQVLVEYVDYYDRGNDGRWLTADDMGLATKYQYYENGEQSGIEYYDELGALVGTKRIFYCTLSIVE